MPTLSQRRTYLSAGLIARLHVTMETFVTLDDVVVCVPVAFLKKCMNNSVIPRLLGWDVEDGLTTPTPSRNAHGHLTILKDMHILKKDFVKLLQFFRVGQLPLQYQQEVYEASMCLGGFDALDAFVLAQSKTPPSRAGSNPMTPKEDMRAEYTWTIRHMNIEAELKNLQNEGWSVTQPVENQSNSFHVYLRRPVAGNHDHQ